MLGFFIESFLWHGHESGILYGPWTFIYGVGSIIIIILSDNILKRSHLNKFLRFLILFFSCFIILTLIELLGGLFIEKIFGVSFWDYTKYRFNVGKYICLEISLLWVVASMFFVFILRPVIDYIIDKFPNFVFYIFSFLFVIDVFMTIFFKNF
jgi:uncharacterized membrane protein